MANSSKTYCTSTSILNWEGSSEVLCVSKKRKKILKSSIMETLHYNKTNLKQTAALVGMPLEIKVELQKPELLHQSSQLQCHPLNFFLPEQQFQSKETLCCYWLKDCSLMNSCQVNSVILTQKAIILSVYSLISRIVFIYQEVLLS